MVYIYFLRVMPQESDDITVGAMPFTSETAQQNKIGSGDYVKTIIGPSTPPAGAPTTPLGY